MPELPFSVDMPNVQLNMEEFPLKEIQSLSEWFLHIKVSAHQSCLTLCDPTNCSPPVSSVHEILQARILEWVAIPFSRRSSRPRDQTEVSCVAGRFFTISTTREALHMKPMSKQVRKAEIHCRHNPHPWHTLYNQKGISNYQILFKKWKVWTPYQVCQLLRHTH